MLRLTLLSSAEVMTRVECQQEEDWATMLVELHNYSTGRTVHILAERVGGDAVRLQPPTDPVLLALIGIASIKGMPELRFTCQTLKVQMPTSVEYSCLCARLCDCYQHVSLHF
jgi:hypothetical protein